MKRTFILAKLTHLFNTFQTLSKSNPVLLGLQLIRTGDHKPSRCAMCRQTPMGILKATKMTHIVTLNSQTDEIFLHAPDVAL